MPAEAPQTLDGEQRDHRPTDDGDPWREAMGRLSVALVLDALDAAGLRNQAVQPAGVPRTVQGIAVGRAKTLQWTDLMHDDPATYELELQAVDTLRWRPMPAILTRTIRKPSLTIGARNTRSSASASRSKSRRLLPSCSRRMRRS